MKKSVLLGIIFVGFALRMLGADWGFPFLLHPDEPVVAEIAMDMAKRSTLEPNEYNHPDHFGIYSNAILYHATSYIKFGKPLTETFEQHTLLYYHMSRIYIAILGTLCIIAAWLIGKEFNELTGFFAALFVAFFPSYVTHSHYITSDIPLTLFTLLVILFTIKYIKKNTYSFLTPALLCSALSVSVKYPGILNLFLIFGAVLYSHGKDRKELFQRLMISSGIFLASLFCISPYLFIKFPKVIEAITINASPTHLGADGLGWAGNMWFYVTSYLEHTGLPLIAFFFLGAYCIVRDEKWSSFPVFVGLLYWLLLSKLGLHWERWAVPMYITPLLVSSYGAASIFRSPFPKGHNYLSPPLIVLLLFAILRLVVCSSVATAGFTLKDTRIAAYQFTRKSGITAGNSLYEGYTPLYPSGLRCGSLLHSYFAEDRFKPIQYVILSSGVYARYLAEKQRYKKESEFYDKIFALPLVASFSSSQEEYFGNKVHPLEVRKTYPFLLNSYLGKNFIFLADYFRNRDYMFQGPTIFIFKADGSGFLDFNNMVNFMQRQ
jgi:hypothetical protein